MQVLGSILPQIHVTLECFEAVLALGACAVRAGGLAVRVVISRTLFATVEVSRAVGEGAAKFTDYGWVGGVGDAGIDVEGDLIEVFLVCRL